MGYPTSVQSFTSKNAGETIQPSHVNDLQTEVAAVETGLLNGLHHALIISTGGLVVSTGAVVFGQRPTMPPPDAVRLSGPTAALANDSTTAVGWPVQDFATNSSLHSTTTNPERLSPQSTGIYAVAATLRLNAAFTAGSTAKFDAFIEDSSGGIVDYRIIGGLDAAPIVALSGLKRFDAVGSTQWVRIVARQRSGSTHSLDATFSHCEFWKL